MSIYCCMVLLLLWISLNAQAATLQDGKKLQSDLINGYNKNLRPVEDQNHTVVVNVTLTVRALQEFDEVLERFSVVGILQLFWTDENMVWNKSDYGGISSTMFNYQEVWVPELILTNPSEKLDSFGNDWQVLRYGADGSTAWFPGNLIKATCSINVYYFPFDIQECTIEMFVWGYHSFEVNLTASRDTIDLVGYTEHGTWMIIGSRAVAEESFGISKAYFVLRLERKSQYILVNIICPILFLSILNLLVFILPAESGERMSYSLTVLLSITVFMTIVSGVLPKTSEPLPLISYLMMISLVISSVITLITVLNLRLFFKKSDEPIPYWLIRVYIIVGMFNRKDRCRKRKVHNDDITEDQKAHFQDLKPSLKQPDKAMMSLNNTGVKKTVYGNSEDQDCSETSKSADSLVSWQDISGVIDYICFIVFTSITVLSFTIFFVVTRNSTSYQQ